MVRVRTAPSSATSRGESDIGSKPGKWRGIAELAAAEAV
jgi:hypothetical protein